MTDPADPGLPKKAPAPVSEVSGSNPVYRMPQPFGRYTLLRRLGVGGMAEAYLAQQDGPVGFQKMTVVKRMLPHLAEDARFVQMFQNEAKVAALLTHTNVVQIYELGVVDGMHFIAMEYVDGAPLHKLARTAWSRGRSVPLEVVCCAVADAALGLSAAHNLKDPQTGQRLNVVHRDISPDNLMMNREGVTKILDFGVAKLAGGEKTATGVVKGKVPFLAPEHILGLTLDGRADVYALGVTFYWLVTGKRPFHSTSDLQLMESIVKKPAAPPLEHNPKLPVFINDLILAMLEKDPADRPQSGEEVHDALQSALVQRRSVVVPFVHDMVSGAMIAEGDSGYQTPGFVPSTPQTEGLKSDWRRRALAEKKNELVEETAKTASSEVMVVPGQNLKWIIAALAGTLILLVAITVVVLAGGDDKKVAVVVPPTPAAAPVPPSPPPVEDAHDPVAIVHDPVVAPVVAPVAVQHEDVKPALKAAKAEPAALVEVKTKAPAAIRWSSEGGKALGAGAGSVKVAPSAKALVAFDNKRGVKSTVPIVNGVADYGALPRGKLQPRANPYAEVFLGTESLGQTPFPPVDVVAGTYVLRFVHDGKEQKKTVEIKAGGVQRVNVDFGG